ncbi:protein kinase [Candidatus Chloroploca sp. Khr17]|uniref:protein kinase domain-containing protein n=1 Tax=Candidatus Chloroploca sp. Khr17 TaxID=2496869 RepID=UPI00101D04D5|nr:protein kinase [Candidatus Chloroploca sp. Khr17]
MTDGSDTPSSNPLLFGRYRVQTQLGTTRLAAVYDATDERLQRRVLLHLLQKHLVGQELLRTRFITQINQMAACSQQTLLEVFDRGEVGGRPFMVTEYCTGRALYGLGALGVEQALRFMRQISAAIVVCQAQRSTERPTGLYHPPISSQNVLIVDEQRVKLVENWRAPHEELKRDQAHYRAPELSEGLPDNPSTAVYALGILLYEMLTGERPITGTDAHTIALAHQHAQLPPLSRLRPSLYLPSVERLLARATARLPEQRFPDVQSFAHELETVWRDLSAATYRMKRATPPHPLPSQPTPSTTTAAPSNQPVARPPQSKRTRQPPTTQVRQVDQNRFRQQDRRRNLVGWLVMMALLTLVVLGSYFGMRALFERLNFTPSLPDINLTEWLPWINQAEEAEMYIVTIEAGLNLRSTPDAKSNTNVIAVVPKGTPVRKLEGPRRVGDISWLRVSVEIQGRQREGWVSLAYLQPQ